MGQTRRQRRSQKDSNGEDLQDKIKITEVPLAQPDRSGPKDGTQTLFKLAAEREAQLHASSSPKKTSEQIISAAEERVLMTATYAVTLSMLHFTLSVLVHHQYAQDQVPWRVLAWLSVWPVLPVVAALAWLAHSPTALRWAVVRNGVFAALSVASGCRLVRLGNQGAYLAVMRGAPPVGVLWVWSVIELPLAWAVASLAAVFGWVRWHGYGLW